MQKNITSLSALNWDDLKFFLEVARTRKASSAAKRLGVDYTTVSRRINVHWKPHWARCCSRNPAPAASS
jgi:hypothetical protein